MEESEIKKEIPILQSLFDECIKNKEYSDDYFKYMKRIEYFNENEGKRYLHVYDENDREFPPMLLVICKECSANKKLYFPVPMDEHLFPHACFIPLRDHIISQWHLSNCDEESISDIPKIIGSADNWPDEIHWKFIKKINETNDIPLKRLIRMREYLIPTNMDEEKKNIRIDNFGIVPPDHGEEIIEEYKKAYDNAIKRAEDNK